MHSSIFKIFYASKHALLTFNFENYKDFYSFLFSGGLSGGNREVDMSVPAQTLGFRLRFPHYHNPTDNSNQSGRTTG